MIKSLNNWMKPKQLRGDFKLAFGWFYYRAPRLSARFRDFFIFWGGKTPQIWTKHIVKNHGTVQKVVVLHNRTLQMQMLFLRHLCSLYFKPIVLMYINPINSKKCVTRFSWIFHFWFIDFSKKIFEIFFHK